MRPPLAVALLVLVGSALTALECAAQSDRGFEAGLHGLALLQDPEWLGGGGYAAWRPGGKPRLALTINAGSIDRHFSGRGELLAHFVLTPGKKPGVGLYALGGIAGVTGPRDQGYLVLGLGLERSPGGSSGWAIEAGVGGGARISVGWRWRWLRPTEGTLKRQTPRRQTGAFHLAACWIRVS